MKWLWIALAMSMSCGARAEEDSARKSFEDLRPLLFQIKTAAEPGAEKTSYGTGFVVRKQGWLVTNFHVVADAVWRPKKNKIFAVVGGEDVAAEILSVDIVNDLALIRIPKEFDRTVRLGSAPPSPGQTLHSLGLPEDLNWTVVNGVSNGILEQGPFQLIHMSSPINHGMSGGPTVSTRQEVVGVNVSGQLFSQAISFAVPVEFVRKLIDRVEQRKDSKPPLLEDIESDVMGLEKELSKLIVQGLKGKKALGGWSLPKFPSSVRCWGTEGDTDEDKKFRERAEACQVEHNIYIDGKRFFGMFRLTMQALEKNQLGRFAWWRLRQATWTRLQLDQISPFDGESVINFGKVRCEESRLRSAAGPRRIRVCSQPILPFKNLHEAEIVLDVPDGEDRSFLMHLTASGLSSESLKTIIGQLMDRPFKEAAHDSH